MENVKSFKDHLTEKTKTAIEQDVLADYDCMLAIAKHADGVFLFAEAFHRTNRHDIACRLYGAAAALAQVSRFIGKCEIVETINALKKGEAPQQNPTPDNSRQ